MDKEHQLFEGKKLLIIGGAFQHVKVVETAKKFGIITYVVDYNPKEKAPAKKIADYEFEVDIFDIDAIVKLCIEHKIDGVLSTNLDICQNSYQKVCERLGFPCFGTRQQYELFTDKIKFKEICAKYGINTIPSYNLTKEIEDSEFPVLVKPAESSSSKGQTICYKKTELMDAVEFAKSTSLNNEVIIEKYMQNGDDMAVCGFVTNGIFHVVRVGDRFLGPDGMERSEILGVYPSKYTKLYFDTVHRKIESMLRDLNINNCPVFLQGLVDDGIFRFYDPGLRFSGCEYERAFERIYGINLVEFSIYIALDMTLPAEIDNLDIQERLTRQLAVLLYIPLQAGTIGTIEGDDVVKKDDSVVAFQTQYEIGDVVTNSFTAKQRYCEIDFVVDSIDEMKDKINWIYDTLKVRNINGEDMIFSKFDTTKLNVYEETIRKLTVKS